MSLKGIRGCVNYDAFIMRSMPEPNPSQSSSSTLLICWLYSHACIDIFQAFPENAIAFEDSTGGIRSAKNAQIAAVVGVETSKDADSLIAAAATISVRDFADEKLLNLLDG